MKLTFWGAAQTVTGSMHEVRVNGKRYLLDCGLYQGRRREAFERNSHFPFPAASVDAVILSHAHIDHSGNLPTLVRNGFGGKIYATPATADLCEAMLADSAYLQEKDAAFVNKRLERRKKIDPATGDGAVQPLYSVEDAEAVMPLLSRAPMHTAVEAGPGCACRTFDAGHILGSTAMQLEIEETAGRKIALTFSGDVGRFNLPVIPDPETAPPAEYLIMESTYGNRLHQEMGRVSQKLADVINRTAGRGGKIIVPAFAVGRTQQLVLLLHQLAEAKRIPNIPIFVDSPLAVNVTEIFRKHSEAFDDETRAYLARGEDPFGFSRLRYVRDVSESKTLNDLRGPFVVISASGMCEAGRILHHLKNNIADPRNTVLITGFQAENTLGRKIVDKMPEVAIFGDPVPLRAEVAKLNELSGHADQRELLAWMKPMLPALKKVFLVHGEATQSRALQTAIQQVYGVETVVPARGDSFTL